ncbi:MAG: hypothetical protein AB1Z63_01010 [Candidatus Limnocylindrales bacterium]
MVVELGSPKHQARVTGWGRHAHLCRPLLICAKPSTGGRAVKGDTDAIESGRVYVDPWDALDLEADAVQYLYVLGDSAIAVTAIDDETATWFLDQMP